MTNRELQIILLEIEKEDGFNLSQVSEMTGIERSYLSKFVNLTEIKNLTPKMLLKFQTAFPGRFTGNNRNNEGSAPSLMDMLHRLTVSYDKLAEAHRDVAASNLLLAKKVSSDGSGKVSSPSLGETLLKGSVEQREGFSDKRDKSSQKSRPLKRVGTGAGKGN